MRRCCAARPSSPPSAAPRAPDHRLDAGGGLPCYLADVPTIPLDEGSPHRRRVGPFWIEEGFGLIAVMVVVLAVVVAAYAIAFVNRPA